MTFEIRITANTNTAVFWEKTA